jgi:hypothetical protein
MRIWVVKLFVGHVSRRRSWGTVLNIMLRAWVLRIWLNSKAMLDCTYVFTLAVLKPVFYTYRIPSLKNMKYTSYLKIENLSMSYTVRFWSPNIRSTSVKIIFKTSSMTWKVWASTKTGFLVKSYIVWNITQCSTLEVNRWFWGTCRLHLQGWRVSEPRNQCKAGSNK